MHNNIEFYTTRQLIKKKTHLGHLTKDWNPKINIFLFGSHNNIHFIDLQQTIFISTCIEFFIQVKKIITKYYFVREIQKIIY